MFISHSYFPQSQFGSLPSTALNWPRVGSLRKIERGRIGDLERRGGERDPGSFLILSPSLPISPLWDTVAQLPSPGKDSVRA